MEGDVEEFRARAGADNVTAPIVDVIIPVHSPQRPIARAVRSVLEGTVADVRVMIVCHNIGSSEIARELGPWANDERVLLMEHQDGIPSPAGPINAGYAATTAEFTALLDSDDEFEPGAIDAWLAVQRRDDADVVIHPLRLSSGQPMKSPPTRVGRTRSLDGVRDRLSYRTRQRGLVRRSRFPDLRMTPGLRTGEDVIQGVTLWYSDARITLAKGTPAYIIHVDMEDRTSMSPKPTAEILLFLDAVLAPEFVSTLSPAQREAFAVKLLRTHLMDILDLSLSGGNVQVDLADLAVGMQRVIDLSPGAVGILSRRDARIVAEVLGDADAERLAALRKDYRRSANLLPSSVRRMLHREAPPRLFVAHLLMR